MLIWKGSLSAAHGEMETARCSFPSSPAIEKSHYCEDHFSLWTDIILFVEVLPLPFPGGAGALRVICYLMLFNGHCWMEAARCWREGSCLQRGGNVGGPQHWGKRQLWKVLVSILSLLQQEHPLPVAQGRQLLPLQLLPHMQLLIRRCVIAFNERCCIQWWHGNCKLRSWVQVEPWAIECSGFADYFWSPAGFTGL